MISFIMPTIIRTSAIKVIQKIANILEPGDDIHVVCDTDDRDVVREFGEAVLMGVPDNWVRFHMHTNPVSGYGNAQRDYGMSKSQNEWFMFVDDDDEPTLTSLAPIHSVLAGSKIPVVFAMDYMGTVLKNSLKIGEVGTPQIAVPSSTKTKWMDANKDGALSDNLFINTVVDEFGGCTFNDLLVAKVTKHGRGVWF